MSLEKYALKMRRHIKNNSYLKKLAPVYVVLTLLIYLAFFMYWRHTKALGNQIDWTIWIIAALAAILIPLALAYNQQLESDTSPKAVAHLALYRRIIGVILIASPFLAMTLTDTTKAFDRYYSTHQNGIAYYTQTSEKIWLVALDGTPVVIGLFLLFLGGFKLAKLGNLLALILALVIAAPIMYALFIYSFRYYQF